MAIRRAAKVDENQGDLVDKIRSMGVSVAITSGAHDGFTDLVIGFGGITVLVEVKDGSKEPARRKLTPQQVTFHQSFKGAITVIENEEQAIELVRRLRQVAATTRTDWNVGAQAYA